MAGETFAPEGKREANEMVVKFLILSGYTKTKQGRICIYFQPHRSLHAVDFSRLESFVVHWDAHGSDPGGFCLWAPCICIWVR